MVTGNSNLSMGEISGPNVPVSYTLTNLFLSGPKTTPISGTSTFNLGVKQSGYQVPAFPSYARSGSISPSPTFGVNVGAFWQALSNT